MAEKEVKQKKSKKDQEYDKDSSLLERLFNFQSENIHIPKSKKAYGYYYADLDSIVELITPYMQKHGIGYLHRTIHSNQDEQARVHTILFNPQKPEDFVECENCVDDEVKLSGMNKFMVAGSAITYFRRYHLVTMLGLTTDEDTDAGGKEKSSSNEQQNTTSKPKGKSIDAAKQESAVDYVKIFDNLVSKKKSIEQLNKMFEKYKKNMDADVIESVKKIIEESNKK